MTLTTANPQQLPPRPAPAAPSGVSPVAIALVLVVVAALIGVAAFSPPVAAGLYVPFYLLLAWMQPEIALWLMFAEVAFPYNVSGGELVHMAPAEISLVLAFPVFWLKAVAAGQPRVHNPIFWPIAAYFGICIFSSLLNLAGHERDIIVALLQMVIYLIIAVKCFSYCVSNTRRYYACLWGLIASCTFFALALLRFRGNQLMGVHKNATGSFLSYSVIILAELWLSAVSGNRSKKWLNILLFVNIAGLVMSTSRGAWIGTFGGLGVLFACRRQYGLFLKGLCLMIPVIIACWLFVPQEQRDYALNLNSNARNVGSRLITIDVLMKDFKTSPIVGIGVGLRKEVDDTNIILSTLAETGVIGLLAFLAIHIVFVWTTFKGVAMVPRNHPDLTFLGLGVALMFCLFLHGCVDHYWSRTQLPVWAMAGAAIAVRNGQRQMLAARANAPRLRPVALPRSVGP